MIAWLLKKVAVAPLRKREATPRKPVETRRATSPENCALWHDVSRALDAKPRASK